MKLFGKSYGFIESLTYTGHYSYNRLESKRGFEPKGGNKKLYIIAGYSGAGKGTLCHYLQEKMSIGYYKISSSTQKILREMDIHETRENFSKLSDILRHIFGNDIFARAAIEYCKNSVDEIILIDGVRRNRVIELLSQEFNCITIFVDTESKIRYERVIGRGEKHNESILSYEAFLTQEQLPPEADIGNIRSRADIVIENNGTEEVFRENIDQHFSHRYQQ